MSSSTDKEKWLEVLAGRAEADDADTELAARTRQHFLEKIDADLAAPVDPERNQRLMNLLEAKGAFRMESQAAPVPSLPHRVLNWLFPAESGHSGRYALVGVLVMAAVVVPTFLRKGIQAQDDGAIDKDFNSGAPSAPQVDLVLTDAPQRKARDLAQQLNAAGASVSITQVGDETLVAGTVPADKATAVAPLLAAAGVPPLRGLDLRVRFKPLAP